MEKHHRFSIWYVIIGIWVVLLIHNMLVVNFGPKNLPYSQFIQHLKAGEVKEVAVTSDRIQGRLKSEAVKEGEKVRFRTVRVDKELSQMLSKHDVTFKGEIESDFLENLLSWLLPILLLVGFWYFMMRRMMGQQRGFMSVGKNKAKIYMETDLSVSFDHVAGVEEAKAELTEVIDFLQEPKRFTDLGGKLPKGVLLVGPPGTGKTLMAKAVAGESHVPFFSISGSEFMEMFVGVGAARVRDLFEQAKQKAPCIIFVDELDALGKARGVGAATGHDEREQTLNQLLAEMDGFSPTIGVILLAATNRPEILDPALLRPGRFDRQVLIDRPDKQGREAIFKVHLQSIKASEALDVEKLASMTSGMVGADIANVVNEAALLAVRREKSQVEMAEFEEAVERIVAGLEKKNRLINEQERKIVAYHEMGHAIVSLSLPGAPPVQKISIIPRGVSALGYTMQVPTEDRFLMKKSELENKIAGLLGGRAAEALIFEDISTGAHNDLSKATDVARSMVKQYGMSQAVGQVYFHEEQQSQFLQSPFQSKGGEYSQATAELIDEEVKAIIAAQYEKALELLKKNRQLLEKGSARLLEQEKIEGEELEELKASIQET